MLMHLVISSLNVAVDFDLLVSTESMSKQAQVPTWKITAMIDPTIQEPELAIQIKSVHVVAANGHANFTFQLRGDAFVGIDDQYPFMLPANILQSPVFFSWEFSVPYELHDPRSGGLGNRLRLIGARRINNDDFLRKRNARKTVAQVGSFVFHRNKHRQGYRALDRSFME